MSWYNSSNMMKLYLFCLLSSSYKDAIRANCSTKTLLRDVWTYSIALFYHSDVLITFKNIIVKHCSSFMANLILSSLTTKFYIPNPLVSICTIFWLKWIVVEVVSKSSDSDLLVVIFNQNVNYLSGYQSAASYKSTHLSFDWSNKTIRVDESGWNLASQHEHWLKSVWINYEFWRNIFQLHYVFCSKMLCKMIFKNLSRKAVVVYL